LRSGTFIIRALLPLAIMPLLTACIFGGPPKCETEGLYQESRGGKRIEAPEGLDDLESYKEVTVPHASPRGPREDTGRCLEAPPGIERGS
jgi:hypothetical protein